MTDPIRPKPPILAYVLIAFGIATFGTAVAWGYSIFRFVKYLEGTGPGETNWPNVFLVTTGAAAIGAAPLVVGLMLLLRRRKGRRS